MGTCLKIDVARLRLCTGLNVCKVLFSGERQQAFAQHQSGKSWLVRQRADGEIKKLESRNELGTCLRIDVFSWHLFENRCFQWHTCDF